jgi:hypothetical protein
VCVCVCVHIAGREQAMGTLADNQRRAREPQ